MRWYRIQAIMVRHLYAFRRNLDRLSDSFYWPAMDIVIWGLTSAWVQKSAGNVPHLVLMLLTALVFWQVVWRANYEISVNLLEEFWNQNLVNLFSTPLKLSEWIAGVMLIGFVKMIVTVLFCGLIVWVLYALNIFTVGFVIIPFLALLLMSGWVLGFIGSSFIIYWGQKVQTIAWTMGFLTAPFSAVYYPLDSLPGWVQVIARLLPTTYIFEGMRQAIATGSVPLAYLVKSLVLNVLYLSFALILFSTMFSLSRAKGLGRLE